MSLTLKEQIRAAARGRLLKCKPCAFRGPTKRTAKEKCCGVIEIFDCSELGREVWHTKCRSCKSYSTLADREPEILNVDI